MIEFPLVHLDTNLKALQNPSRPKSNRCLETGMSYFDLDDLLSVLGSRTKKLRSRKRTKFVAFSSA